MSIGTMLRSLIKVRCRVLSNAGHVSDFADQHFNRK
jgi:hypothetical protein